MQGIYDQELNKSKKSYFNIAITNDELTLKASESLPSLARLQNPHVTTTSTIEDDPR